MAWLDDWKGIFFNHRLLFFITTEVWVFLKLFISLSLSFLLLSQWLSLYFISAIILLLLRFFLDFNFTFLWRLFLSHRLLLLYNRVFGYLVEEFENQVNDLLAPIHDFLVFAGKELVKGVIQSSGQILKTNLVFFGDGLDRLHLATDCLQILKPGNWSIRQC